jgi:outer membrane protein OmpA-like peptidoglycan-associated protein
MTTNTTESLQQAGILRACSMGASALLLVTALSVPAFSQTSSQTSSTASTATTSQSSTANSNSPASQTINSSTDPNDATTYATGKPLAPQSKEGFWGHMNPLARKKWVNRQVEPIKDRTNELDQLQARNANDIRDVDSRAQAGIRKADAAAAMADQHALEAGNRADLANGVATTATSRTDALHGTVENLDQYQAVSSSTIPFAKNRTSLGTEAKSQLDTFADRLSNEKGYVIEVEGYSRAGVQSSQAMADSVVRYLVTEHNVPIYRIYRTGMGKATPVAGEETIVHGVRIKLLHNSLASMQSPQPGASAQGARTNSAAGSATGGFNQ